MALFFTGKIVSYGSGDKTICAINDDSITTSHQIQIADTTRIISARIAKAAGGTATATSAATFDDGEWHMVGILHDVTNSLLHLYIDPADGLPSVSVACTAPEENMHASRELVIGAGSTGNTLWKAPNDFDFGDPVFYVGATLPNAAGIAELYAAMKTIYTDLP
jgi:hypothetical protein